MKLMSYVDPFCGIHHVSFYISLLVLSMLLLTFICLYISSFQMTKTFLNKSRRLNRFEERRIEHNQKKFPEKKEADSENINENKTSK